MSEMYGKSQLLYSPVRRNNRHPVAGPDSSLDESIREILDTLGPDLERVGHRLFDIRMHKGYLLRKDVRCPKEEAQWVLQGYRESSFAESMPRHIPVDVSAQALLRGDSADTPCRGEGCSPEWA
jgi:hypothetical protein